MDQGPKGAPVIASTQDFMEVADVMNDLLLTKTGQVCLILLTSSVNFDLLSEVEQDMKIQAFSSLVNSLDFNMQILIDTQKVNISAYAEYLDSMETQNLGPGLSRQFLIYKQFVRNLIINKEILDKKFMIIIPFNSGQFISPFSPVAYKQKVLESAVNYLYPKKYHILKMLKGMGLDGTQMTTREIVKYLHSVFNPGTDIKIEGIQTRI